MKPLLVGQAPGPRSDPAEPLSGRCGARLAELCGLELPDFLARFDRVNLIKEFPGKAGKGDAFPMAEARANAINVLKPSLVHPWKRPIAVVLLGGNVCRAFFYPPPRPLVWVPSLLFRFSCCPHPSGVNRWWNDPANVRAAQKFWRRLEREAE